MAFNCNYSAIFAQILSRPTIGELVAATERHKSYNQSHNIQQETSIDDNQRKLLSPDSDIINTNISKQPAKLKENLFGFVDLVLYGLCATVGSGIYVLAGTAAKNYAGPGYVLSLFISGIISSQYVLGIAEFSSRVPVIGCAFTYIYLTSGELLAFFVGFFEVISSPLNSSVAALGVVVYLESLINEKEEYEWILLGYKINEYIHINFAAPILLIIFTLIVITNISFSKTFLNGVTIWNMILIIMFIISGLFFIDTNNLIHPCDNIKYGNKCPSDANNSFFPFGFEGILIASGLSLYAFDGPDDTAKIAQESKNSTHNIPRAIYTILFIVFVLYCCVAVVLLGMIPFQSLDSDAALSKAFGEHNQRLLQQLCSIGALTTMSIGLFCTLISMPRIWLRMSIDGFIPEFFKYIHPKYNTPFTSTLIYCIAAILFAAFFNLSSCFKFLSTWSIIRNCCIYNGIMILRYSKPNNMNHGSLDYNNNHNKKVFVIIWLYTINCWITSFFVVYSKYFNLILWYILISFLGIIGLICFIILIYFDIKYPWKSEWMNQNEKNKTIFMPFVPYLPCFVIAITSYMLALYGILFILELLLIFVIGLIFYVLYSYHHIHLHQMRNNKHLIK